MDKFINVKMVHTMDEFIQEKMEDRRAEILGTLSRAFPGSNCEGFGEILAINFIKGCSIAEKIANKYDLYLIDFCAILRDYQKFGDLLLKEIEDARGEALYYDKYDD